MSLSSVRIVLVEPAGSRNLGSVARVMKNMGLHHLILVNPHCHPRDPEARMMAVHAAELLSQAQIVGSLPEALADCHRVVGTTGRDQAYPPEWQLRSPRHALPELIGDMICAIVFGPEDRGLSNDELALCQYHVMIPTDPAYPSLNLAQAVGIIAYEVRLSELASTSDSDSPESPPQLQGATMAGFFEQLEALLLQIGYLQPQTVRRKLSKFRALFNRAELTLSDVALLRGVLRQLGWYHHQQASGIPLSRQQPDQGVDQD
ncbi:MAG: RNA methyltransferase [Synechococcaceae cyanobacterium RM1_1_27]|nr:RNA methyltransferase [Synechococcaceae cyanobacterium SM2_3_2]NJO85571.1 RNA methyltransferase [Synechococcaceae cyanobacterium RM1_1_27]